MIEKIDEPIQVEFVLNTYDKNESEPICIQKSETDKSSKHNTLEFLDFFKMNHEKDNRDINLLNIKAYSRPISIKSSLNLSKEMEGKNFIESKEASSFKAENLLGEFETRWKSIESYKSLQKTSKVTKSKSSKSNQINLRKNNYKEKKRVEFIRPNLALKHNNSIELPTDKDIDTIIKSLNHKKIALFEYNRQNQKESFIKIKNESKSYLQSTKPSINSLNSLSAEKNAKSKEKNKNVLEKMLFPNESVNSNANIMSPNLKNKFIETLEDIIEYRDSGANMLNLNKCEPKIKKILDQYKDLNSVERNFYSILNNINPNMVKVKKDSFREKLYLKKSQRGIEDNIKKNKNYLKFEKNFSMIDQISRLNNCKGHSIDKKFESFTVSESSRDLNKSFFFKKRLNFPESPRIKRNHLTNISSYECYKNLQSKLCRKNIVIDKSSLINDYSSNNNIQY